METIFLTVKKVFQTQFNNENPDFKKGFEACYLLFDIGFKKTSLYNYEIKLHETEKELEKVSEDFVSYKKEKEKKIKTLFERLYALLRIGTGTIQAAKSGLKTKTCRQLHQVINSRKSDNEKILELKRITANWDE